MASRICADVGGTFTDLVMLDDQEMIRISKSPTTPEDHAQGVLECVNLIAGEVRQPVTDVLRGCRYFGHGSTVITNAVIEGKVAKVGFLVTRGFRDILSVREAGKENPFNMREDFPKPYVPRYLTLPVTERINAEGDIEVPLDEDEAKEVLRKLIDEYRVEAIAVCLLWSIANPVHEKRIKEIAAQQWPNVTCVLSSEANPIIREYRRAVSTVIEASVRPIALKYIRSLDAKLKEREYQESLYIVTSSGAVLAAQDAVGKGISMIASGPAMAPVAAKWFSDLEGNGEGNVISIDMGGTSFDVSLVTNGEIARTRECKVGNELLGINVIDSRSIGAGGGSIAWIDPAGLIHVGPESAGAVPGPACYHRGGNRAAVTDANVVLGYIDPDYFLGGRMKIEPRLAEKAIKKDVAEPLHLGLHEAAFTVWSTVNVNMVSAIQDVTVWQGIDPREYVLVAGGGAGNCHAAALARELGMRRILVPRYGGVLSAVGGLVADVCADFSGSCFTNTNHFDYDGVNRVLEDMEHEAQAFLERVRTFSSGKSRIEFHVEARYSYQVWELPVKLRKNRVTNGQDLSDLIEDFHEAHEKVFAFKDPMQSVEFVHWSARATSELPGVKPKEQPYGGENPSGALMTQRPAYFRDLGGMTNTRIYQGNKLMYGNVIKGPAIIEETTTTIVIPPWAKATVTQWGNYAIEIEASG
jgi:N-methylhydantoinase A